MDGFTPCLENPGSGILAPHSLRPAQAMSTQPQPTLDQLVKEGMQALVRIVEEPNVNEPSQHLPDLIKRDPIMRHVTALRDVFLGIGARHREAQMQTRNHPNTPAGEPSAEKPARERVESIVQYELANDEEVEVFRMSDGTYDVVREGEVRHTPCSAEDVMRAMAHYSMTRAKPKA